jgi:hypothetical protein
MTGTPCARVRATWDFVSQRFSFIHGTGGTGWHYFRRNSAIFSTRASQPALGSERNQSSRPETHISAIHQACSSFHYASVADQPATCRHTPDGPQRNMGSYSICSSKKRVQLHEKVSGLLNPPRAIRLAATILYRTFARSPFALGSIVANFWNAQRTVIDDLDAGPESITILARAETLNR